MSYVPNNQLTDNDVLLGRGDHSVRYKGNIRFRQVVLQYQDAYLTANRNAVKNKITRSVIQTIWNRNGRFLKKANAQQIEQLNIPTGSNAWIPVTDDPTLMKKIKQAFRDLREDDDDDENNSKKQSSPSATSRPNKKVKQAVEKVSSVAMNMPQKQSIPSLQTDASTASPTSSMVSSSFPSTEATMMSRMRLRAMEIELARKQQERQYLSATIRLQQQRQEEEEIQRQQRISTALLLQREEEERQQQLLEELAASRLRTQRLLQANAAAAAGSSSSRLYSSPPSPSLSLTASAYKAGVKHPRSLSDDYHALQLRDEHDLIAQQNKRFKVASHTPSSYRQFLY